MADDAGSVFDWTTSLWGIEEDHQDEDPEFGYPCVPSDVRENLDAPPSAYRVLRGASWLDGAANVPVACGTTASPRTVAVATASGW